MTHPFDFFPAALGFALVADGHLTQSTDAGFTVEREHTQARIGKNGASASEYIREWQHAARNLLIEQHFIVHSNLPMAAGMETTEIVSGDVLLRDGLLEEDAAIVVLNQI